MQPQAKKKAPFPVCKTRRFEFRTSPRWPAFRWGGAPPGGRQQPQHTAPHAGGRRRARGGGGASVGGGGAWRVLNRAANVSPDVRAKVEHAMAQLEYQPIHTARALRSRSSRTIGCMFSDITNP